MKKKTVGTLATELKQQAPVTDDLVAIQREAQKDYEKHFWEAVDRGSNGYWQHADKPNKFWVPPLPVDTFYVVVETKAEQVLDNVIRNYFYPRISCPTPNYDQVVYKYWKKDNRVEFVWVIPSRMACHYLKANKNNIDPEEHGLLDYVMRFDDGTLFKLCKILNGEEEASPLLES